MRPISFRLPIGLTLALSVIGTGQPVCAQILNRPAQQLAPAGVQRLPAEPGPAAEPIDVLIFGTDARSARDRLESRLIRVIDQVDEMYELTPEQEKKLELAGRGDIKRFFDRISELKKKLDPPEDNRVEGLVAFRDLHLQLLRQEFQLNHFDDDSLFSKTLNRMLTPAQRARYKERDRVATYRTRVNWVLFPLDHDLGLSREQHRRLLELIAKETRPLQKYGELDDHAILLQASRLPEDRLKPIFDEAQWRRLQESFARAQRMESDLVEKGYLARGKR